MTRAKATSSCPTTEGSGGGTRVVVSDANVIINLIHVERLALFGALPRYDFVIPEEVDAEIKVPEQRARLSEAIHAGLLRKQAIVELAAVEMYAELRAKMGRGEAACLALAASKGWLVASDEKRVFRREAIKRLGPGRLLTTPGLFVLAIRAGVLSIDEADEAKRTLERHRFRMGFTSFRDVMHSDSS